jgi:hypothetical protein
MHNIAYTRTYMRSGLSPSASTECVALALSAGLVYIESKPHPFDLHIGQSLHSMHSAIGPRDVQSPARLHTNSVFIGAAGLQEYLTLVFSDCSRKTSSAHSEQDSHARS